MNPDAPAPYLLTLPAVAALAETDPIPYELTLEGLAALGIPAPASASPGGEL